MKNKIIRKKRIVKKKVKRVKKISSPAQWGKEFEKLAHRDPVEFNFIKPALSGDPFASQGGAGQRLLKCLHEDQLDAMRYFAFPELRQKPKATITPAGGINTRGELGAAPAHYANGKYTPWEIVDDWKLDYYCGNALKYVCRHKHKGKPVEDIQKAIDCLIKYKANLEKETK